MNRYINIGEEKIDSTLAYHVINVSHAYYTLKPYKKRGESIKTKDMVKFFEPYMNVLPNILTESINYIKGKIK